MISGSSRESISSRTLGSGAVVSGRVAGLLLAAAIAWTAGPAAAIQFSLPSLDTRLHTPDSVQPGAEWTTAPAGGDVLSFDSVTGVMHMDAEIFTLNYFDPNVPACPTNVASNCPQGFAQNLDISLDASLNAVTVTDIGFGFFSIDIEFVSTGGTDISVTDPSDATSILTANWAAGIFNGSPTTGITLMATYNDGSVFGLPGLSVDPTLVGFAEITGGAYAQLFDSGSPGSDFGVHIGEIFEAAPGKLDALAAAIVSTSILPSFSSVEAQGQVFRLESGAFVIPEPGTLLLGGLGVLGVARLRRRLV